MKSFKFKSIILVTIMFLSQSVIFANNGNPEADNSKVFIKKSNTEQGVTLRLVNLEKVATAIYMKDADKHELFRRAITKEIGAVLRLDFSKLENGTYSLFIDRESKSYIQTLSIENGELKIGEMKEIFKPILIVKKNNFVVDAQNTTIQKVELINKYDVTVYEKTYSDLAKNVRINYSLKQIPNGNYLVKVTTSDDYYYTNILVK